MTRRFAGAIVAGLLAVAATIPAAAAGRSTPLRVNKHTPEAFDQILRENALFFNMLVSFSFTAAVSEPAWGIRVRNINLNLVTREVRDPRGRQLVRVRVAGAVRNNNNVELDILDETGLLVGKGFFGYQSGQLTFFDRSARPIITGFIDSGGNFVLDDLRLPPGQQSLSSGFVDPCFFCSFLSYAWYDGLDVQVGGGRMFPTFFFDRESARMYWSFEAGKVNDSLPAFGEADYEIARDLTGAINSVLFDGNRTAADFFANPYGLVPEPLGMALLPRFTDDTGIAVTNPTGREIEVTYIARRFDGGVIAGAGIENPVTYRFPPGLQYAAFPAEIFRTDPADRRPILPGTEPGWMEIFSDDADVQAMFLEGDAAGTFLDGNVGAESGGDPLIFTDLRLTSGQSTEIALLNLSHDPVMVRLELLDVSGNVLREEREFFVAGYGMRRFLLGEGSDFLRTANPEAAAGLRVRCNNSNTLGLFSCSRLVGLATYRDRATSLATALAASADVSGTVLVGAHFVTGRSGAGAWETSVRLAKLDGASAPVHVDFYAPDGRLLATLRRTLAPGGLAGFDLAGAGIPWGEAFQSGYVRVRSDSGKIAGHVSLRWSDGVDSQATTYPLSNLLSSALYFNQVAQGAAGEIEYWTGLGLMNDLDRAVDARVQVIGPDGRLDREVTVRLQPFEQRAALLSQILQEPGYRRLDGYIRVTASAPIVGIVFYGDTRNRFLSVVPAVAR